MFPTRLLLLLLVFPLAASAAERVACHYTYGGEEKVRVAEPVGSPYGVAPVQVGSYFLFRVVWQRAPAEAAAVKVYTYADREGGPVLVHQATYPYPPPGTAGRPYGFTGLQFVYEPVRDGELQYWCALEAAP